MDRTAPQPTAVDSAPDLARLAEMFGGAECVADIYPCSALQAGLLFHAALHPGTYISTMHLQIDGQVNRERLEDAWQRLIERHSVLRTGIFDEGVTTPLQVVVCRCSAVIRENDLRQLTAAEQEAAIAREMQELGAEPFDLAAPPLARFVLLRTAESCYRLIWAVHHALLDGWSCSVLIYELFREYSAPACGTENSADPVLPFRDFIAWLQAQDMSDAEQFWTGLLANPPLGHLISSSATARGTATGQIDETELSMLMSRDEIERFCRAHQISIFSLLHAAWAIVLSRVTGTDDVIFGVTLSGRNVDLPAMHSRIGLFVNTVPTRIRVPAASETGAWLRYLHRQNAELWQFEQTPLSNILEWTGIDRARPLFDSLLLFENYPVLAPNADELGELKLGDVRLIERPHYPVTMQIFQSSESHFSIRCYFDRGVLAADSAAALGRAFDNVIKEIVGNPSGEVSAISLAGSVGPVASCRSAGEERTGLPDGSVVSLFRRIAAVQGETIAVQDGERTTSYSELAARAAGLAERLVVAGVGRGDRVGLSGDRSAEMIVGMLAVLQCGGCYVPLDPDWPTDRTIELLTDSGIALVISTHEMPDLPCWQVIDARDVDRGSWQGKSAWDRGGADSEAYIAYTSGSTGRPKGVVVPQSAIVNFSCGQNIARLEPNWRVSHLSHLSFDAVVFEIWSSLLAGATIVILERDTVLAPKSLAAAISAEQIDAVFLTTAVFNLLVQSEPAAFTNVKRVYFGGEAAEPHAIASVIAGGKPGKLYNVYGPTESTAFCIGYEIEPSGLNGAEVPIGTPFDNIEALVFDKYLNPLPPGIAGELYLAGLGLAYAYQARRGTTAERFRPHPRVSGARMYCTGDLVIRRQSGDLVFRGRTDRQMKIRGFRVEPGEIETVIRSLPGVIWTAVEARGEASEERRIVAFIAVEDAENFDLAGLRQQLKRKLPAYLRPSAVHMVETVPVNATGKVDLTQAVVLAEACSEPAATEHLIRLLPIWCRVLGVPDANPGDNFFEVGGHSLLAARLTDEISREWAVAVPLGTIFDAPTLEQLAAWLEEAADSDDVEPVPTIAPRMSERYKPFPLNDIQRAYWLGRKAFFTLGNVSAYAYSETDVLHPLDPSRVEEAWNRLIDRHDALRLVIRDDGTQQILPAPPRFRLAVHDLRDLDERNRTIKLSETRERLAALVLPLEQWPMFTVELSQIDNRKSRLHLGFDGLICDAWSVGILMSEFERLYSDPDIALPPLSLSFRDYVIAELEAQGGSTYQRAVAYWRERLDSLPDAPPLPLARRPESIATPHFSSVQRVLPQVAWEALKANAARNGITPTAAIMTLFAETLALFGGEDRFLLNMTVFNRQPWHTEVDSIIGDFTSVLPVEFIPRDGSSFSERAIRTQVRFQQDFDNRAAGMWALRELRKQRGNQRGGALPVVFTSTIGMPFGDGGDTVQTVFNSNQTPQVWIDFQLAEVDAGLVTYWAYIEELFPTSFLDAMRSAFDDGLDCLAGQESNWHLDQLIKVPAGQLALRSRENCTTITQPVKRLEQLFLDSCDRVADRPAVIWMDGELSYAELRERAAIVREIVLAMAQGELQAIAVMCDKGPDQIIMVLGIMMAGHWYVPIDPDLPPARIALLLADADAHVTLTNAATRRRCGWPDDPTRIVIDEWIANVPSTTGPRAGDTSDLAYVIYTSGSTGAPKGVMIDHSAACNTVLAVNKMIGLTEVDRVLSVSKLTFDLSVYDIFGVLAAGAAVVLPETSDLPSPSRWRDQIRDQRVTVWNSVPALLELTLRTVEEGESWSTLRCAMLSGDWIPLGLPDLLRRTAPGVAILAMGGATEAAIWSNYYWIEETDPEWRSIPYGRPLANQTMYVLDESLDPVPDWTVGEIFIGGAGLARGYAKDKARSAAAFITHPKTAERLYRTGDLGRYFPDGMIEIVGRRDNRIKLHGHRIELGEIEAVLRTVAKIDECLVDVQTVGSGAALVAYVVAIGDHSLDRSKLQVELSRFLPRYMIPNHFIFVEALPLSANGKVDRSRLPELPAVDRNQIEQPQTEAERSVTEVWCRLLRLDHVGTAEDFFDVGGDSLMAALLAEELKRVFGAEIAAVHLFEKRTIAEQARMMSEALKDPVVEAF